MYDIQNFVIASSFANSLLFFCSDYQKVVKKAINEVMEGLEYNKNMRLIAYLDFICIEESNGKKHLRVLDNYTDNLDLNSFCVGEFSLDD